MKFIIFICVALLLSACEDTEKEKKELLLKQQQQQEQVITIMPDPVKLPEMKKVRGHVD